jgi:hypothetical protein
MLTKLLLEVAACLFYWSWQGKNNNNNNNKNNNANEYKKLFHSQNNN